MVISNMKMTSTKFDSILTKRVILKASKKNASKKNVTHCHTAHCSSECVTNTDSKVTSKHIAIDRAHSAYTSR